MREPSYNVRREAARRRKVQVARLRCPQHKRTPLRLHVIANQREQAVDQLRGLVA